MDDFLKELGLEDEIDKVDKSKGEEYAEKSGEGEKAEEDAEKSGEGAFCIARF